MRGDGFCVQIALSGQDGRLREIKSFVRRRSLETPPHGRKRLEEGSSYHPWTVEAG